MFKRISIKMGFLLLFILAIPLMTIGCDGSEVGAPCDPNAPGDSCPGNPVCNTDSGSSSFGTCICPVGFTNQPDGGPCADAGDCQSNICVVSDCTCGFAPHGSGEIGDPCTDSLDCIIEDRCCTEEACGTLKDTCVENCAPEEQCDSNADCSGGQLCCLAPDTGDPNCSTITLFNSCDCYTPTI